MNWLEENRPDAFQDRNKEKLKTSIQTTLSAQANKKEPKIQRYRKEGSRGSGYIWTLSSTVVEAERASMTHSVHDTPPRDDSIVVRSRPDENVHASSLAGVPEGNSRQTRDASAASTLLHLHMRNRPDPATETATDSIPSSGPDQSVADNEGEQAQTTRLSGSEATPGPRPSRIYGDVDSEMQTPQNSVRLDVMVPAEQNFVPPANVETSTNRASDETGVTPTPLEAITEGTGSALGETCRSLSGHTVTLESRGEQYLGNLVSKIHRLRRQRKTIQQEIQVKRDSMGQVDVFERRANDLLKRVEDLERQAQQAREQADVAREGVEKARAEHIRKEADIASANEKLDQLAREEKEARESLDID
ncbi:hypothetical protein LTR08_005516 [Meristemomyces frigidus]|nr:hypothetical protein LTR08_005516 [Meristemomyces frigidus]